MGVDLNPHVLREENCTFRAALAYIAHCYPHKTSVEKLQAIALDALSKHRKREEPAIGGHGDLFDA